MPRVIVGDGPLRARVPDAVGFVPPPQVGAYYERAAVVVCPSHREGYGVAAREAMAHGRPVVAIRRRRPARRGGGRRHRPPRPTARSAALSGAPITGAPRGPRAAPSARGSRARRAREQPRMVDATTEATIAAYRDALSQRLRSAAASTIAPCASWSSTARPSRGTVPRTSSRRSGTTTRATSRRRRRSSTRRASAASTRSSSRSATTARLYTRAFYDAPYDNEHSYGRDVRRAPRVPRALRRATGSSSAGTRARRAWRSSARPSTSRAPTFMAELGLSMRSSSRRATSRTCRSSATSRVRQPMFLSTGGGTLEDIDRAVDAILAANEQLCVLHCTAAYPADVEDLNLRSSSRRSARALPGSRHRALRPPQRHRDGAGRASCSARGSSRSTSRSTTPGRAPTMRTR